MFVLTHHLGDAPDDPAVTFLPCGLDEAVSTALEAAEGRDLVLFGSSIGRQCVEHGLVDDILVHVVPVLLGDGLRFLDNPGGEPVSLERVLLGESGQVTDMRSRVRR